MPSRPPSSTLIANQLKRKQCDWGWQKESTRLQDWVEYLLDNFPVPVECGYRFRVRGGRQRGNRLGTQVRRMRGKQQIRALMTGRWTNPAWKSSTKSCWKKFCNGWNWTLSISRKPIVTRLLEGPFADASCSPIICLCEPLYYLYFAVRRCPQSVW